MLEAETELLYWQKVEEDTDYGDAMDSMERKYAEGLVLIFSKSIGCGNGR